MNNRALFLSLYGLPHPPTLADALHYGEPRYMSQLAPCAHCAEGAPVRYTEDGSCFGCASREYKHTLFNLRNDPAGLDHKVPISAAEAVERGLYFYFTGRACSKAPHPERLSLDGRKCVTCSEKLSPRGAAVKEGAKVYTPATPCRRCGTKAPRLVANGRCSECHPRTATGRKVTPRLKAIAAGAAWYEPKDACGKCGMRALKRVNNGSCRGCENEKIERDASPSAAYMKACPDEVISREDARALGFKVYRTGRPCARGHAGFRYVSTCGCLDCKVDAPVDPHNNGGKAPGVNA